MRIPDNLDIYEMYESEKERWERLNKKREWEENKEEEYERKKSISNNL